MRGFCRDGFSGGFFLESIFGVEGSADSFDADAVSLAFGFGVSAGGGAEAVEAGVGGAVAIGAALDFTICGAADGPAGFGVSARGGAEAVEAGGGGAAAIGALSGLTICGAADGTAGFGVPARGGAEAVEAGVDGAVAIGVPSGRITCEGSRMAGVLGGTGVNAGGANSKPKEARCEASSSPFPPAGAKPLFAGAVPPSGRVSKLPACEGASFWLSSISKRESLEGLRVCSFCGLAKLSVAVTEGSRSAESGALFMRAKLTPIVAATVSAIAPAVSVQRRELGRVDV